MVAMSTARRTVLGAGIAVAAAVLTGCREQSAAAERVGPGPSPAPTPPRRPPSPRPAPSSPAATPLPTTPAELVFTPGRTLRPATRRTRHAALLVDRARRYLVPTPENPQHPGYAGATVLAAVNGAVTAHAAVGDALRYGKGPVELPPAQRVAMRTDSVFDLASITKVFTTLLALQEVDRGRIDLAAPVAQYLPAFRGTGKSTVTVGMLLTHTSGLPVGAKPTGNTPAAMWDSVLATPLVAGAVPGNTFRYSSVGLMVLGQLIDKLTGRPLDAVVRTELTGPLGLRDTGFKPLTWMSAADQAARLVATDARPARGVLRGVVHDDVANKLGGIAGHAGLFSTAADVAVIGQMLINGGEYAGKRILAEPGVRRMLANANAGLPAVDAERPGRTSTHGLGVELDQPWFMGRLASPLTFGHTGFTGTSLLVEPRRRVVLVFLTNRAHPDWTRANPDPSRIAVANALADALAIT
jgi:CubicO group peptidase (beta-lactamase class C family)